MLKFNHRSIFQNFKKNQHFIRGQKIISRDYCNETDYFMVYVKRKKQYIDKNITQILHCNK